MDAVFQGEQKLLRTVTVIHDLHHLGLLETKSALEISTKINWEVGHIAEIHYVAVYHPACNLRAPKAAIDMGSDDVGDLLRAPTYQIDAVNPFWQQAHARGSPSGSDCGRGRSFGGER